MRHAMRAARDDKKALTAGNGEGKSLGSLRTGRWCPDPVARALTPKGVARCVSVRCYRVPVRCYPAFVMR
jgi:hypothetical protein